MNTIVSYVSYLGKTLWPVDLACFYPYSFLQLWQVTGAASVLLAISVAVVFLVKRTPFLSRWLVLVFRRSVSCQWIDAGGGAGNG